MDMRTSKELLFDLIESEALVNIYLDREGFTAKGAGIIITSSVLGHFPKRKGDKVTLWFGLGVMKESFKTKKAAYQRAIEILQTAERIITPRIEGSDAKKFKKLLKG